MEKRHQLFISSTYLDMVKCRKYLISELWTSGYVPAGMEAFSASSRPAWWQIERDIRQSDGFVLILTGRYGTIENGFEKSYIEREFDIADELGLPIWVFIAENGASFSKKYADTDLGKIAKLQDFTKRATHKRNPQSWSNKETLALRVFQALRTDSDLITGPGWVRGGTIPNMKESLKGGPARGWASLPAGTLDLLRAEMDVPVICEKANKAVVLSRIGEAPAEIPPDCFGYTLPLVESLWIICHMLRVPVNQIELARGLAVEVCKRSRKLSIPSNQRAIDAYIDPRFMTPLMEKLAKIGLVIKVPTPDGKDFVAWQFTDLGKSLLDDQKNWPR